VHVISATSHEASVLREFRDALILDQNLRRSYIERKQSLIGAGITDSVDYSDAKHEFISGAIKHCHPSPEPEEPD
jgi:GrpB-like predicted nucleotidyltransferase (UPF0157 family)